MTKLPSSFSLRLICIVIGAWLSIGSLIAGEFNRVLSIGDKAPMFESLPGVDDKTLSAEDFQKSPVTVVVFTCNSCPYAVDVQERLVALQRMLSDRGGKLVAINVNKVDEDLLPEMKKRAKEAGFRFPYLFDETQQVAKQFGATTTPEFFVLDGDWKVAYMGSLDDSPDGKSIDQKYVEMAVDGVLTGSAINHRETVPIGCRIRFDRKRNR